MVIGNIFEKSGFDVRYCTSQWRIALHSYNMAVNSMEALKSWGVHWDSEEGFFLLNGNATLLTITDNKVTKYQLLKETFCIVEKGEWHAIVLEPDSEVLIIENADMSQSETIPIGQNFVIQ
ncbi:MAG: hypothetical protein ACK5ML_03270 [Lachnospiraceae bacterium]